MTGFCHKKSHVKIHYPWDFFISHLVDLLNDGISNCYNFSVKNREGSLVLTGYVEHHSVEENLGLVAIDRRPSGRAGLYL
jgi:hypothetical protein